MKKTILYIFMFTMMISVVTALEMCEDTKEINTNCTMVTPTLTCTTYNYSILNASDGLTVSDGTLTVLSGNVYYFNFTQSEGDYVVKLCDDTTREVKVKQEDDDKMIIGMLILVPLILGTFLIVGAATLGEDHNALRIFLFLLTPITFFVSLHFVMIGLIQFYNVPELVDLIGTTIYWSGIIWGVLVTYFIIYWLYKIFHTMAQKKKERLEY